jgi:transcriptional regulator with XRE-family HTH domain
LETKVGLNLEEIQRRLLETLRERVQNGELTERGLARSAGISQPHVHNVLKGVRNLSLELIDLVLKSLDCSVLDLCTLEELTGKLQRVCAVPEPMFDLPFIYSIIGPGQSWADGVDWQDRNPVPCAVGGMGQNLVLARLSTDIDMRHSTVGNNIAVLDLSEFQGYSSDTVYVIDRGYDAVLRHIRPGFAKVYLVADANLEYPERWEAVSTRLGTASVVRARVCWFGKETNTAEPAAMAAAGQNRPPVR